MTYRVEEARAFSDGSAVSEETHEESYGAACDQHIRQLVDDSGCGELLLLLVGWIKREEERVVGRDK